MLSAPQTSRLENRVFAHYGIMPNGRFFPPVLGINLTNFDAVYSDNGCLFDRVHSADGRGVEILTNKYENAKRMFKFLKNGELIVSAPIGNQILSDVFSRTVSQKPIDVTCDDLAGKYLLIPDIYLENLSYFYIIKVGEKLSLHTPNLTSRAIFSHPNGRLILFGQEGIFRRPIILKVGKNPEFMHVFEYYGVLPAIIPNMDERTKSGFVYVDSNLQGKKAYELSRDDAQKMKNELCKYLL